MKFEWDGGKAASNVAKHGVSFAFASQIWNDPRHVILVDRIKDGEQRWHALGLVGSVVILVVVYSYPDPLDEDCIRIISARRATRPERRQYEQNNA